MKRSRRVLSAIFISLLSLVVALVALLAAVLAPSDVGVVQGRLDGNYTRVLADIEGIREANPRYIDMACLGSHDSFTADLEKSGRADQSVPKAFLSVYPLIKNFVFRFGQTQTVDIYNQLLQGVRFLHIKVTYYQGEWYTSHTILSGTLADHMTHVLRYLALPEAQGEIVGIIFQPIYMGDQTYNNLRNYIADIRYMGKNLYDYTAYADADLFGRGVGTRLADLRYNLLTDNGNRAGVVLFERRDDNYVEAWDAGLCDYPVYFDLDANAIHTWHNRSSRQALMAGIDATCKEIESDAKYNDMLRINQTQATLSTGSAADIFADIGNRSLLSIAAKHNAALVDRADFMQMLHAMPVFQVDYATSTEADFNARVNALIRQYNIDLVKGLYS